MARLFEEAIQIEVKANLSIDEPTVNLCLGLLRIYAKQNGYKNMLIKFDDAFLSGWRMDAFPDREDLYFCPLCGADLERKVQE